MENVITKNAVNSVVMIYEDRLTKLKPEGKAKLLKRIPSNRDDEFSEYWKVKFISDGFITERMVSL